MKPFPQRQPAFTLIEMLVATAILAVIVVMLASVTNQASALWRRTTGKISQFREARAAFEAMTTRLSQATLNTYWDYDAPAAPTKYERRSELRFISGIANGAANSADDVLGKPVAPAAWVTHCVFFQAPLGVTDTAQFPQNRGFENLLSTWGYYLEFNDDHAFRPSFLTDAISPPRFRFRLMELWQTAEANLLYQKTSGFDGSGKPAARSYTGREWFRDSLATAKPPVHVLAENIIALILTPRLAPADEASLKAIPPLSPLAPNYLFDTTSAGAATTGPATSAGLLNSKDQLPPLVQVTMVAIDETSALRLNFDKNGGDKFGLAKKFQKSAAYNSDLLLTGAPDSLEKTLNQQRVNYRIFSTNVVIRGAKWSREQKN